jgi:LytS/YehU family sensor histidine kinase
MGLQNVRQRLAAAYGEQATLHWSVQDGRFQVRLSMPAEGKP